MSSTAKAIAIGAASAVGIALIAFEIKRRLSLSSLEASVGVAPSLKAAAAKPSSSQRGQAGEGFGPEY